MGRAPNRTVSNHPDGAAKAICRILLAQFKIPDGVVGWAFGFTQPNKLIDMERFETFMGNQDKHLRGWIFAFLTRRVKVLINCCGGLHLWLEAGYAARQEIFQQFIDELPGHITLNIFSPLKKAFPYARIFAAKQVNDTVHQFRALIVYQIARLLEDTFNFAISKDNCNIAKSRQLDSFYTMCRKGHNVSVATMAIPKTFSIIRPARWVQHHLTSQWTRLTKAPKSANPSIEPRI